MLRIDQQRHLVGAERTLYRQPIYQLWAGPTLG